jgi:signal transduction histidine kinase
LELLVERARALGRDPEKVENGTQILKEGAENHLLYIVLKGEVTLSKIGEDGSRKTLDRVGPGSLVGILSFWTGKASFMDAFTVSPAELLLISQEQFDAGVAGDPEFARITLQLLVANLGDRYRRVVGLNLRIAGLTKELEGERNALREAVSDLKRTRNQLVHKEKLATMGQLLAGIAHEINNPASSLMKNVENLVQELPLLFGENSAGYQAFTSGQHSAYVSTGDSRERMNRLQAEYPGLSRTECRRLSRLSPEMLAAVESKLGAGFTPEIDDVIRAYDVGSSLHSIRVANERITRLVKSLKSYSRQDEEDLVEVNVGECIQDTLMILNHDLKRYDLQVDVPDLPGIPGRAGEVNQILTNLLTNAMDASVQGKRILVQAGMDEERLWIEVADEGPGIPENLIDQIFEPNVTTKSGGGEYGLGLGLAISRDIAMQHHGNLTGGNRSEGGAVFRLELPLR